MYQALYRQFRPLRFDSVYGQEHITRILQNQLARNLLGHAYLFTGTRGTGKTTCAKILARAVNCEHPDGVNPCNECEACRSILSGASVDVTELDAASNNGVDNIRAILAEAAYPPVALKKRVYIIDEVHMLSIGAFNALLKTLEEPPEHVLFILATTELHKVPQTILSRCQRFDFRRVDTSVIAQNLRAVSDAAGIDVSDEALTLIARLGDGSIRDAQSLLERCRTAGAGAKLDIAAVTDALGVAGADASIALAEAIGRFDTPAALKLLDGLAREGRDMRSVLEELAAVLRDILIFRAAGGDPDLLRSGATAEALAQVEALFTADRLSFLMELIRTTLDRLVRSTSGRTETELALIRASQNIPSAPLTAPAASVSASSANSARAISARADVARPNAAPVSAGVQSLDLSSVNTRLAALEHSMQTAPGELSRRIGELETAVRDLAERPVSAAASDTQADKPQKTAENKPKESPKVPKAAPVPEVPSAEVPKLAPELHEKLRDVVLASLGVMKSTFWMDSDFFFDGMTLYVMEGPMCQNLIKPADSVLLREAVQTALGDGVVIKSCEEPPKAKADKSGFDAVMGAWNNAPKDFAVPQASDNSKVSQSSQVSQASQSSKSSDISKASQSSHVPQSSHVSQSLKASPASQVSPPPYIPQDYEAPPLPDEPPFDLHSFDDSSDEPDPPEPPDYL